MYPLGIITMLSFIFDTMGKEEKKCGEWRVLGSEEEFRGNKRE